MAASQAGAKGSSLTAWPEASNQTPTNTGWPQEMMKQGELFCNKKKMTT